MVTIVEVAKQAGVSKSTASRVLTTIQGRRSVRPATAAQVLKAANELGYQPNMMAVGLKTGQSRLCVALVEGLSNPMTSRLIEALVLSCGRRGYHLLLEPYSRFTEDGPALPIGVDGVFIVNEGTDVDWGLLSALTDTRKVVLVGWPPVDAAVDQVSDDDHQGVWMAVEHLARLGHSEIGFIGAAQPASMQRRFNAFLNALSSLGLFCREQHCEVEEVIPGQVNNESHFSLGFCAMEDLLMADDPPTAILCANDLIACGAVQAAIAIGAQVPEDISVCGFGDTPQAQFSWPPLTTVQTPVHSIAETAAEMMVKLLRDGKISSDQVFLSPKLVVRGSTGAIGPRTELGASPGTARRSES